MDKKKTIRSPGSKSIAIRATHEKLLPEPVKEYLPALKGKNPDAVILGRLGGLKAGKARAEKLSPGKRKETAKKAAMTRRTEK